MAGGISEPFIRHPVATSLLMVGILFVGVIAYPRLPVAPLPQVDFPTIQVSAKYPGAGPDTMASAVAQPLETQFAQISGVSQMTSTSTLGSTAITIQFDLDRDIDAASTDIQAAINAASGQLPKDLPSPPTYRKVNPADFPILLLAATSTLLPLTEVDDNVETKLAQQISQVPGVAQVTVGGQQKPAIRIQLDPAKLVAKGLSLEDVRTPLSVTTLAEPKGAINGGASSFTVGQEGDGQSVVFTGLTAGETVVTAGQYRLVQGSLVQPSAASSATPPGGRRAERAHESALTWRAASPNRSFGIPSPPRC